MKKVANKFIDDVYYYLQGNSRYHVYYSSYSWLIRDFIMEQIKFRILVMDQECYNRGTCVKCGCKTTALQMADKMCEGSCYPPMLTEEDWRTLGPILKKAFIEDKELYRELIACHE